MHISLRRGFLLLSAFFYFALILLFCLRAQGQTSGSSGTIQGTVTDPSGAAIAKARVTAAGPGYRLSTTTDDQGRFAIENLPASSGQFTIEAPGFTPLTRSWNADASISCASRTAGSFG